MLSWSDTASTARTPGWPSAQVTSASAASVAKPRRRAGWNDRCSRSRQAHRHPAGRESRRRRSPPRFRARRAPRSRTARRRGPSAACPGRRSTRSCCGQSGGSIAPSNCAASSRSSCRAAAASAGNGRRLQSGRLQSRAGHVARSAPARALVERDRTGDRDVERLGRTGGRDRRDVVRLSPRASSGSPCLSAPRTNVT